MKINWNQIRDRVRSDTRMAGPKEAILRETELIELRDTGMGTVARLALKSQLSASMLQRLLLPDIQKVLEDFTGKPTRFEFEISSRQECFALDDLESALGESRSETTLSVRFRERLTLDAAMDLKHFIETDENRYALAAIKDFSSFADLGFSVLALHGPSGVGKSHLLHGAGLNAKQIAAGAKIKVVTGDEFITDFQAAIVKRNMADFRRRYRLETDILLVDDLHSLCRAKGTQEEFFNLMNHIATTGRRLIITSDRTIESLDGLEDRIKSRLLGGLVIPMIHPSEKSRCDILNTKLLNRGIEIKSQILLKLARKAGPCIRSLEGVVNALSMMARTETLNDHSLSAMVADMKEVAAKLSSRELMEQVAAQHGLSFDELRGRSRSKKHVNARKESMRRLKTELGLSQAEIGRLHLRDHSTVVNALKA